MKKFGATSKGNQYKHWLTEEEAHFNFITPDIHTGTLARFENHKAGDLKRILTNTAASQPFCFNLIIFLQQHSELADKLFSNLLDKQVKVIHLEPEFTPNECNSVIRFERTTDESIGDQGNKRGTDSDIAVFYTYDNDKKGVLLIEFKFIEAEFSVCSSYADKKQIKATCDSANYFLDMITNKKTDEAKNFLCGYNRYFNWQLTAKSKVIDGEKVKSMLTCPFRFGLNQLWRNMMLAEQVALSRHCDEFGFWVFSPSENDNYLWKKGETERQFREILTQQGNNHFKKVHLENIFDKLHDIVSDEQENTWLTDMETKYRIS
ncbi:MAG: hypothetical protein KGZ58_03175 [Ignavibacteriales bacterium]|nr:hypothetical protein [Ignavibacteriales bacterium]